MTSPPLQATHRVAWFAELAWFNATWASLVFGHQALPWLGPGLALLGLTFISIRNQLRSVLVLALIGCAIDQSLTALGLFSFAGGSEDLRLIPYWLVVLWFCFSATLHSSLAWLVEKPVVITVVAFGISGPFSYWVAFKAGAYSLPHGLEVSVLILGLVWAFFGWLFPHLLTSHSRQIKS
ncbi:DUF2878 domain-containing protein [Umboniibacter marinipuniceus]|uniref:Uncharacterized protein DUF2878 n=1 Tax=Umboniibacter marinipuniceus TaxID=569599 RepID=A0A3M0ABQ0_9GAMM|nr:DUF2878 domain-containing protein [Umboniibacter marinipuniceus]RMA80999.1 uncharacterized protein DUF2878 [Umboniibacter marinipuniceus]